MTREELEVIVALDGKKILCCNDDGPCPFQKQGRGKPSGKVFKEWERNGFVYVEPCEEHLAMYEHGPGEELT